MSTVMYVIKKMEATAYLASDTKNNCATGGAKTEDKLDTTG